MSLLWNYPVTLPVAMTGLNILSFGAGLLEGRLKMGALKFAVAYASTVPQAARGDLTPFFTVLSLPPT